MQLKLYSIYDTKTGIYYPPTACHNAPDSMRAHTRVFNGQNQFAQFPGDYSVVEVGTFDDKTGLVTSTELNHICAGPDLVETRKPENLKAV